MKAFIRITIAVAIIVSLGFTYISVKEAKTIANKPIKQKITKANEPEAGGDNIRSKTYKLVNKKLVKQYSKKHKNEPKKEMFSRCPSGNRVRVKVVASSKELYSFGVMHYYKGCESRKEICQFRARLSDNSVDILQSDSINYVAADLWIEQSTAKENFETEEVELVEK